MTVERSQAFPIGALVVGVIGTVAFFVGVVGFAGAAWHPLLGNQLFCGAMLAIGIAFFIIEAIAIVRYAKARRDG